MKNVFTLKKSVLAALLVTSALATGCSSSQKAGDGGEAIPLEAGPESSADAVGSIPEDALNEDSAGLADASSAGSEAPAADASADNKSDPFADLTAKEEGAPAADASADAAPSPSGEISEYTVKAGDTLMKVAFSIYGDIDRWKDLRDWNQDSLKGHGLRRGMTLKYEAPAVAFTREELGHSYLIKSGDTLAGIADDVYGRRMKYKKLQGYNPQLIKNVNRIFAGFTLFYDITPEEMAQAEARRKEKAAAASSVHMSEAPAPAPAKAAPMAVAKPSAPAPASVPSAVKPVPSSVKKAVAAPVAAMPAGLPDLTQEMPAAPAKR